ncbi:MAG TPA: GntR family transcriptional regulator [Candidatus Saccharimonadales bacterium]|nr:GntR family transcriptional regulator [Candidatus Saccharimonadales bacterium]
MSVKSPIPTDLGTKARLDKIIASAGAANLTAQDLVLTSVREAILTAALPPGSRLRQEKLAEMFGTSRIPVREALRALEYEGLVSSIPYRGFTVTELDADDIEEVYDLRILLESHAIRLAVPLMTDDDLAALEGLYTEMVAAPTADGQLAAREQFYIRLYSMTGRPRLVGLISRLRQEVARSLRWPTLQHAPSHHERFFEAIRAGDADSAAALLASHYRRVAILIRRYLRDAASVDRRTAREPGITARSKAAADPADLAD